MLSSPYMPRSACQTTRAARSTADRKEVEDAAPPSPSSHGVTTHRRMVHGTRPSGWDPAKTRHEVPGGSHATALQALVRELRLKLRALSGWGFEPY
eukprot:89971-Prymnesium_polylepis.1